MEPLILIGGGGHCVACIDVIEQAASYEIIGILDLPGRVGQKVLNYPVIGTDTDVERLVKECPNFMITLGQILSADKRIHVYEKITGAGGRLPVIISPYAAVSKHAFIDAGTIIMHHALVNASAKIGVCSIINSKALIEHDTSIGDFCHISTAAVVNGQCCVGERCFIGSNAVLANNISICSDTTISAGTRVMKHIEKPGIYAGNLPIKKAKKDIYILGAGGFARETYLLLRELNEYEFIAFVDRECPPNAALRVNDQDFPVISESLFDKILEEKSGLNGAIAVGFPTVLSAIKNKYCGKLHFPNIIHPNVRLNEGCTIGTGNIIGKNNVFTDNISIGSFNIFNIGSTVGHDVTIGNCNVINSSCNISGNVTIGSNNLIGVQSVILQRKSIGNHNVIGAGSVLIRKVPDNTTVFGVPALKF